MSRRLLIAFLGFIVVVLPGFLWWWINLKKRQKLYYTLLSNSKDKRRLWHILKSNNYEIVAFDKVIGFSILIDGNIKDFRLMLDFIVKKNGRLYGAISRNGRISENIKVFYTFLYIENLDGLIFFIPDKRSISVWEIGEK